MDLVSAGRKFEHFLKKADYLESTIKGYGTDVDQFLTFLMKKGLRNVDQAKENHLNQFFSYLDSQDYAPRSISHKINALRVFYQFLKKQGVVKKDLTQGLKHPKSEAKEPRILSKKELEKLRKVIAGDVRYTAIIETFLQTGMRLGELVDLELKDVTLNPGPKYGEVRVREKKSVRKIPINNAMEKTMGDYLKVRPKGDSKKVFVTSNCRSIPARNVRRKIMKFFKKAKIESATVNDLRNTFIAFQLTRKLSVERVAYLVGYKNLSSMNKFLKKLRKQMKIEEEQRIEEL